MSKQGSKHFFRHIFKISAISYCSSEHRYIRRAVCKLTV